MAQPKPSTTEMSMPTFETLEEWTRSQIQSLMQSVLDEEVTHAPGRSRYERQAPLDAPRRLPQWVREAAATVFTLGHDRGETPLGAGSGRAI